MVYEVYVKVFKVYCTYFRLSKAAVSRYKKLKEQSTAGLKDIVQHHKYTEVIIIIFEIIQFARPHV